MQAIIQALPYWVQLTLLLVPAISAVFAAIGLLINVRQSRRTNAQARAALVAACLKGFADDEDIQSAFYAIEYSTFRYGAGFHGSAQERQVDKLLRHFANIALAWQAGLVSIQDVMPIKYYVVRVVDDLEMKRYLEFIRDWSAKVGVHEHPYQVLEALGAELRKTR